MVSPATKVWFVTGCSSGFGLCIAEYALKKGDKVVATLRKPEVLSSLTSRYSERLLVLKVDVTEPSEVIAAIAASKERFGRIDVVVNNAGFGIVAEVEGTSEKSARSVFEVNFWGASHVSREAVRFFREENNPIGGRLLQVTSLSGIISSAGAVYYCASKFALEALSEGLAEELHPNWNIKVGHPFSFSTTVAYVQLATRRGDVLQITIVEPGPFRTKCPTKNAITEPIHPAYADSLLPTMKWRALLLNPDQAFNGDPHKFAEAVYKAAYLEDPPLRLPIHPVSLVALREKGRQLLETADKWESWSADVLMED